MTLNYSLHIHKQRFLPGRKPGKNGQQRPMPGFHGKVLREVCYRQTLFDYAFASYQTYADAVGVDRRTVIRAMGEFEDVDLVRITPKLRPDGSHGANEIRINWDHEFWKGCPLKRSAAAPSARVGSDKVAPAYGNAESPVLSSVGQSSSVVEETQTEHSDQPKTTPRKLKAQPPDPALVRNFQLGAQDRHIQMPEALAIYVLMRLAAAQIDGPGFLRWVERNHSPRKARKPKGFWGDLVKQAARVPHLRGSP